MDSIEERRRERTAWSDERLTADLLSAAAGERGALVELLLDLVEFEKRELSQQRAYSSLFDYCTRKLGYSSSEAGRRIAVARKGETFPLLLIMLERGELHLSGAGTLAGLLTPENYREVLLCAKGRSQEAIARMAATLAPKRGPKDSIRVLRAPPEAAGLSAPSGGREAGVEAKGLVAPASGQEGGTEAAGAAARSHDHEAGIKVSGLNAPASALEGGSGVEAPSPSHDLFGVPWGSSAPEAEAESYAITFQASRETRDLLERAKEVLRHRFPRGRIDEVLKFALKKLLAAVDRDLRRPPRPAKPAAEGADRGRYIPEAVKQAAWARDGGRCAFIAPDGTRCAARAWLEFDHRKPYALGGSSRESGNIRLYCRPHNQWAAKQVFSGH